MLPARSAVLQHAALCCVLCLFVFSARAITIDFDDVTLASCTSTNVTRVTIHAPRVNDTINVIRIPSFSVTTNVLQGASSWLNMIGSDVPRPTPETAKWKNVWPENTLIIPSFEATTPNLNGTAPVFIVIQSQFATPTEYALSASLIEGVAVAAEPEVLHNITLRLGQRRYFSVSSDQTVELVIEPCIKESLINISSILTPSHAARMLVNSTIDPTILDDVSPYSCSAQLNHGDSILMTLPPPDDSVHIPYVELCAPVYLVLPPTPPSSPVLVGLDVAAPTLALLADAFEWQMSLRAHSPSSVEIKPPLESLAELWVAAPIQTAQDYPHLLLTFQAPSLTGNWTMDDVVYEVYSDLMSGSAAIQDFLNNGSFSSSCFLLSHPHLKMENVEAMAGNATNSTSSVVLRAIDYYTDWEVETGSVVLVNVVARLSGGDPDASEQRAVYQPNSVPVPVHHSSDSGWEWWEITLATVLPSIALLLLLGALVGGAVYMYQKRMTHRDNYDPIPDDPSGPHRGGEGGDAGASETDALTA